MRRRLAPFAMAVAGVVCLSTGAGAQTPAPVYFTTTPDAVTGDNTPVSVPGFCSANKPCYLPDPNPSDGSAYVDSYVHDVYERPTGAGSKAGDFIPGLDIISSRVGYDDDFLYYRIDLFGGPLDDHYMFEINFDDDVRGDLLVEVTKPSGNPGGWSTASLVAYLDQDQNVGGPNPAVSDAPTNTDGYEFRAFQNGNNSLPGAPGGTLAIRSRMVGSSIELAVSRPFLVAAHNGNEVTKASFRPNATKQSMDRKLYIHDEVEREKVGSPFPWLRLAGAPAACPSGSDALLTQEQRDALESGTSTPTSHANPCYPDWQVTEFDNGGSVTALGDGGGLQFYIDLEVAKSVAAPLVGRTDTVEYRIAVRNLSAGAGQATGVTVTDTLPATLGTPQVTTTTGTCSPAAVVTCALGDLPNGDSAVVVIRAPALADTSLVNRVRVAANETDTLPANNVADATVHIGSVSVVADGVDTLALVPSNGVPYGYGFAVSHTFGVTADLALVAYASSGATVLALDSLAGPGVAPSPPDSGFLAARPAAADDSVRVWFQVNPVAAGESDSLFLRAVVAGTSAADSGWTALRVVRPAITMGKSVDPVGSAAPGTDLTYMVTFSNAGEATADSVVLADSVPPELAYKIGSETESLPTGVSAIVQYSNDGGAAWSYTPASGGCGADPGYDACVTHVRWVLQDPLSDVTAAPENGGSVQFVARVR